MKSYLRIIITSMVAFCVTISSFAGAKKCDKKPVISRYYLNVPQKPGGHGENEPNSNNKGYCTFAYFIIDIRPEEVCISMHSDTVYMSTKFAFLAQGYSNPPFAPPRFV